MKKNYFGMIVAAAMMFAGFSLTSCSENDVAIIDGEVWVKPEVQLTDDGAIVKGSSPSDISRMISRVKNEISAAAEAGKSFKISVEASAINSTSADNAISIPTVTNSDIVLSFSNPIQTEVPLVFKSKGVGDDATAAASTNKLEIDIPAGSSKMDLNLIFPTSTVTLKGGAVDEVIALTGNNTLIIENGFTVNWLKRKGGNVIVKNGGKVNGTLCDGSESEKNGADVIIGKDGINPGSYLAYDPDAGEWKEFFYIADEDGKAYYTQNLKIIKGEETVARVAIENGLATDQFEKLIIDDGAATTLQFWWAWDEKQKKSVEPKGIKLIEGIGNRTAKIYGNLNTSTNWETGEKIYGCYLDMEYYIKEIKNLTVDGTLIPDVYEWDDKTQENVHLGDVKAKFGYIYLGRICTDCDINSPQSIYGTVKDNVMSKVTNCNLTCPTEPIDMGSYTNTPYISRVNAVNSKLTAFQINSIDGNSENNTFKGKYVNFSNYYISGNDATVKNCKFEGLEKENGSEIILPYQTENRSSFDFIFDTCEFGKGYMISTYFSSDKPWVDKDGKQIAKGYYWFELEEDGKTIKRDDDGNYIEKRSANEDDVPAANKANGEWNMWGGGYEVRQNPTEPAEYKDYKAYITFKSTTLDGKDITAKTDFISNVYTLKDKDGNPTTATYFVLDGSNYEAVYNSNTQKWNLIAVDE